MTGSLARCRRLPSLLPVVLLLAVTGCGGAHSSASRATSPTKRAVAVRGPDGVQHVTIDGTDALQFVPNVIDARIGTIDITMKVTGQTPHTLTFDSLHKDTGYVAGNSSGTLTVKITKAGVYHFDCDYHPYMTGTLVVTA